MSNLEDLAKRPVRLADEPAFRIGELEVQPATRRVSRGGQSLTLEPRVMQVLVALAQADGRVVGRDELIWRCWEGRIVGDNAVHRIIAKLRELENGAGGGQFTIETIPRVGYRLTPREGTSKPAEASRGVTAEPQDKTGRADNRPHFWNRRQTLFAGAASLAAAAGAAGVWVSREDPAEAKVRALLQQSETVLRLDSADSSAQGAGLLEEAVKLAPDNALAWGRLALVRSIMAEHAPPDRTESAVTGTQFAAQRALALDRRQPDALAALALLPPYYGDWRAAELRMKSVLEVDPKHLPTLDAHSFLLMAVGRGREGSLERIGYAQLDPLHAGLQFRLIYAYWIVGRVNDADQAAERALQLWPRHWGVWGARLWTLAGTGRAERALAHVQDLAGRPEAPPAFFAPLELAMYALVHRAPLNTQKAVEAVLAQVSQSASAAINGVMILNALGEVELALDVAEAYLLERGPIIANVRWRPGQPSINDQRRRKTHMLFVPTSAPMRGSPRFDRLMKDIGLARYWDEAGVLPDHQT